MPTEHTNINIQTVHVYTIGASIANHGEAVDGQMDTVDEVHKFFGNDAASYQNSSWRALIH